MTTNEENRDGKQKTEKKKYKLELIEKEKEM